MRLGRRRLPVGTETLENRGDRVRKRNGSRGSGVLGQGRESEEAKREKRLGEQGRFHVVVIEDAVKTLGGWGITRESGSAKSSPDPTPFPTLILRKFALRSSESEEWESDEGWRRPACPVIALATTGGRAKGC